MNPILALFPVTLGLYLLVAVLERIPRLRFEASPFLRSHFATDVVWHLSTLGVVLVTRPFLLRLPASPLAGPLAALPLLMVLPAAALVYDFTSFLIHVGLHRSNALWEIHKIHHSSRTLDWLATTRQHAAEGVLRTFLSQAILFLVGFPLEAIVGVLVIYVGFAALGHGNLQLNLQWAEPLFVTPRLHRLHHIPQSTEHNFGTIFSLWDRLFGTLILRDARPDELFGVPDEVATYPQDFVPAFLEPLRRLRWWIQPVDPARP